MSGGEAGRPREADADRILRSISDARERAGIVIAYHHNHAFDQNFADILRDPLPEPPKWIKAWTYREVDAGADIVVLHGVPVVQRLEIYKGCPVFYDMGNLIFPLDVAWRQLFEAPNVYRSVVALVEYENTS